MKVIAALSYLAVVSLQFLSLNVSAQKKQYTQSRYSSEDIMNGKLGYPSYSMPTFYETDTGFAKDKLGKVPPAGIHPRILFAPADIPGINQRLQTTDVGKELYKILQFELSNTSRNLNSPIGKAVDALASGNIDLYRKIVSTRAEENNSFSDRTFQNSVINALKLEALDCLLKNDKVNGQKAAAAIANWAKALEPEVKQWRTSLFPDDASRWGSWHALGSFALFATHNLGDAYDLSFPFMDASQREQTRSVIAGITKGAYTFATKLPHQLRSWNWVNFSNCLPLLALSIEGEKGYDKRVYDRGVEVMKDYILNNYSTSGSSTEAIGYTGGGWKDGVPAVIAMARRGSNLMLINRFQAIKYWHLNEMLPQENEWLSHGDLGNYPPGLHEIMLAKYFFPADTIVDYNFQQAIDLFTKNPSDAKAMLLELIVMACDVNKNSEGKAIDYKAGAALHQPLDFFDNERGNLTARTAWSKEALQLNFECRTDGYYAGHEHADRGNFNVAALGRLWTPESPRSPSSKYHNIISIDGRGQGYFPTPGKWLGLYQSSNAVFASCDTKYSYDWFWPKSIVSVDTNSAKFKIERFSLYRPEAVDYQHKYVLEKETHPNVVARFRGFDLDDSGMWDEDPWTVRIKYNPVEYAFRTAGVVRGRHPYVLVVDDIKKDGTERLYEWNMMVANDLEIVNVLEEDAAQNFLGPRVIERSDNTYTDVVLGSEKIKHVNGVIKPAKGEPLLLVRLIEKAEPADIRHYDSRPNPRLETIEKKDDFSSPGVHLGAGGRSWGLAKRLVFPSRSVAPSFKVMIYPFRYGVDSLPKTEFGDKKNLQIEWIDQKDLFAFIKGKDGRTTFQLKQDGEYLLDVK